MSIMRTYYTWEIAKSSDKSYVLAKFGLWSDGEFAVGIIVGCFPTMPKFFQHVGPEFSKFFSWRSKSASNQAHDPRSRSKTSKTNVLPKIKHPFAKYRSKSDIAESGDDAYSQLHGEYYTLEESETSKSRSKMTFAPFQTSDVGIATRRNDLEYGHQNS